MRSRTGVGITPPKVLGAPKPQSSVMISSTLGAPLGGTTRGAHHGLDWAALRLISPPNFGVGFWRYLPSMVVVALGDPGTPVVCWAGGAPGCACNSAASLPVAAASPPSAPSATSSKPRNLVLFRIEVLLME